MFKLISLPYEYQALEPAISAETLEYHHGKHHRGYVDKLNELLEQADIETQSLHDLVVTSTGEVFNNAAQVWNHDFYWLSLCADGTGRPTGTLAHAIYEDFGSFDAFRRDFSAAALAQFGSGWTWLTLTPAGTLVIEKTSNADTPLRDGRTPLLVFDVWEHAYYIDYRNARKEYVDAIWDVIDWVCIDRRFAAVAAMSVSEAP